MYISPIEIGPLVVHPFGPLAVASLLVGFHLARRHTRGSSLSERVLHDAEPWLAGGLFGGAHLYSVFIDYPERLAADPWVVLRVWDGISSFGGLLGIMLAAVLFCRRHGVPLLAFVDRYAAAFPAAWAIGRFGCTLAFDHPGTLTDFPLAMLYPGSGSVAEGLRHNLGLYEAIWGVVVAAIFWRAARTPRRIGWYTTALILAYMPVRFALDFLRVAERSYGGITDEQMLCTAFFAAAVISRARASATDTSTP